MRGQYRIARWVAAVLLGVPLLLSVALYSSANSAWGRKWIEHAIGRWTAGTVRLEGLAGQLPGDLSLARLELRDSQGLWLAADQVQLRWSPWQLLRRNLRVATLQAATVEIARAPSYPHSGKSGSLSLPGGLHLQLDQLAIGRLELSESLAGNPVDLQLRANAVWFTLSHASLQLQARRLDAQPAIYSASAHLDERQVQAQLDVEEQADGPLGHLAQLPALGALSIHLQLAGPRDAVAATLTAQAGALHAQGKGRVDLRTSAATLDFALDAAAMAPRPGVSWQRLHLTGRWQGPLRAPDATAELEASGLELPWIRLQTLNAQLRGAQGGLQLEASVAGLVLPKPFAGMLADAPLTLQAQMRMDQTARPLEFTLAHPLIRATGQWSGAITDGSGNINASVSDLKPFAALAALELDGRGTLEAQVRARPDGARVELSSGLGVSGGRWPLGALLTPDATLTAALTFDKHGFDIERAQLDAGPTRATLHGSQRESLLDLSWTLDLRDLSRLSARLAGQASGSGRLQGRAAQLSLDAALTGDLAANGGPSGRLRLALHAHDLPARPTFDLDCNGVLDGTPLAVAASLVRTPDGALVARIQHAQWRSAEAEGVLHLPADMRTPNGHLMLRMARVEDLDRLLGQPLQGSVDARVEFDGGAPGGRAQLKVTATDLGLPSQRLQSLQLTGSIAAPLTQPVLALQLRAQGVIGGVPANLQAQADGPLAALALRIAAQSGGAAATPTSLTVAARFDDTRRELQLNTLDAQYEGQTLHLRAPALLSFAQGLVLEHLQLALGGGGRIDASAQLQGSWSEPHGTLSLKAVGLRGAGGLARALPALDLDASAQLQGSVAQVTVQADGGARLHLKVTGQAPLTAQAPIALKLSGDLDLALANPLLEASGQRLLGQAHLAGELAGTPAAPQASGTLVLTRSDLQDYPRGLHLSEISATLAGDGAQLRLQQFRARAGTGTVSASGTLGLAASLPVALKLQASAAQTLTSDLITATVDLQLTLDGALRQSVGIAGKLHVIRADINIPDAFPPNVAVLDVRRAGRPLTPPADTAYSRINLDVAVDAPRAVFVRGRGVDAEVGGSLHVGGTIAEPDISGGFDLRNGTVAMAGASLSFTSGRLSFNGTGVKKKMDPTLDFTASKSINGVTANLNVGGFADAPVITLTSTPEQTQDQILSLILFGVQPTQLSTLQIAQIAAALATMTTGIGNGFSPLSALQRKLRLDRLAISGSSTPGSTSSPTAPPGSTASSNTAATIEAGRYVTRRVYVGAKQSTSGSSQAQVQVDLTKHLKVETVLGTGGGTLQGATPQNDPGSSVGLSYQLEY